jgi:hypothetical protein
VYVSDIVHMFIDDNPFRSLHNDTPKMFFFVTHQKRKLAMFVDRKFESNRNSIVNCSFRYQLAVVLCV